MLCHFDKRAGCRDGSFGEVKPLSNGKYLAFEQDCQLNSGLGITGNYTAPGQSTIRMTSDALKSAKPD